METRWTIHPCGGDGITVCNRLEVYALPVNPSCTLRAEPGYGYTRYVTVSCSTSKVYPRAECRFYSKTDNGDSVQINNQITYSHPEISGTPVYYRSECSVTVEVKDLGEGTHRFTGYIYPGVTGGHTLVGGSNSNYLLTHSFPQASHSCDPQMVQGYFTAESSTCTCSLSSVGYPRGTAQWYQGDQRVGSGGILVVTHDRASSDQKTYTCEGESNLGRKTGSTLTPNFAFEPVCSPVKEGQQTTLSQAVNTNSCLINTLVTWRAGGSDVAQCTAQGCSGRYSGISVDQSSTLTISSVSRTDPFNMETRWTIHPCGGDGITVCNRLEVYALPENPSCTVREEPDSGDTRSVTVSCSTSKVYPRAECRFYSKKDNGNSVQINNQITYSNPETSGTPVYYRSECSVTVEVKDLGEGTHSFTGYIYPGVTGGHTLVGGSDGDKTVTLSFPQASHSCDPQMVQGYFTEESSTCTCSLSSVGYPRGTAQWYQGDQRVGSGGILVVTHDRTSSDQKTYTCEGESNLGRKTGSTVTPNFALNAPESPNENQDSEGGSLKAVSVAIGVVAMVVIAGFIIFVAILLKKIRRLREKLDTLLKDSPLGNGDTQGNGTYLSPVYIPEIVESEFVSASQPQRQGQYETVDDLPASRDIIPVSASQLPGSRQYETVDDMPDNRETPPASASQIPRSRQHETVYDTPPTRDALPVSASHPPEIGQYETLSDMASTAGTYHSTSPLDVEPANVYLDIGPDLGPSGHYSNVSGRHGDTAGANYSNVGMCSVTGHSQNKK
ncbi:hypothetical protein EGW08_023261, partial [Elysia chlorotica]